jgi:hypothetical protein
MTTLITCHHPLPLPSCGIIGSPCHCLSPLPSCPGNAASTGPCPPLPSCPNNAATPTMQRHTCRLRHPSPPPTPCHRPTNTGACPSPPSPSYNVAVWALCRRCPANAAACPPLPKLIVVCARLPPFCHCHKLVRQRALRLSYSKCIALRV